MLRRTAPTLLLALVAGCAGVAAAPAPVRPTLEALRALGLRCGAGVKDNVPSGLYQWSCSGSVGGVPWWVSVSGNDVGIAEIDLTTPESTDPGVARAAYARLVAATPPLSRAPALAGALGGWTGPPQAVELDGVRVWAGCDATQCNVFVVTAGDAIKPMPIP